MTPIDEILHPGHVNLALAAESLPAAVDEILSSMRGDARIPDWDALRDAVAGHEAPLLDSGLCSICIAHGRTNAVHSLAMGVGISPKGFESNGAGKKIRLVFVAGIPAAFNNEYLRVVGSIARQCKDPAVLQKLLASKSPAEFIGLLAQAEAKI